MIIGKPAPFVNAFIDAVDEMIPRIGRITVCQLCSAPGWRFASRRFW